LIIGAARSATTSLHYYLRAHPQIAMSLIKEPNFFLFDRRNGSKPEPLVAPEPRMIAKSISDPHEYERLFDTDADTVAVGESSPLYLYVREAPELIDAELDQPKLIAVVRDPIDRAWSHHVMIHADDARDVVSEFRRAVERELDEPGYTPYAAGTHLLRLGRYGEQVERYLERFDPDRLLVLTFDEVRDQPDETMARICEFLEVDSTFDFGDLVAYNGSNIKQRRLTRAPRRAIRRIQPWLKGLLPARVVAPLARYRALTTTPGGTPDLPEDLARRLADYFRDDMARLAELVDVDVTEWPTWQRAERQRA
jgi:hypothetical protein